MSLILQALRKSEAQRQLGQVPSLLSAVPGATAKPGNRWRRVGYGLVVVVVASAAWWLGQRGQHIEPGAVTAPAPVAAAPDHEPIPARPQLPETTLVRDDAPVPVPPPAAPVAPVAPVAPPHQSGPAAQHAMAAADAPATPAPVARQPAAQEAPAPIQTAPGFPTLADLAPAQRQDLPPLRITMHVFADQPAQRFAIIDGHRVGEGALLGDGVVLTEITRAGVILDLRGRRVLVPRP